MKNYESLFDKKHILKEGINFDKDVVQNGKTIARVLESQPDVEDSAYLLWNIVESAVSQARIDKNIKAELMKTINKWTW